MSSPRQKIGRRLITRSYFDLGGKTNETQPRGRDHPPRRDNEPHPLPLLPAKHRPILVPRRG